MPESLQILDPFVPLEMEVVNAMLDLLDVTSGGVNYVDLGCGDGRFLQAAIAKGCGNANGIELDPDLATQCQNAGLNVSQGNIFDYDLKSYNRFTFWFAPTCNLMGFLQLMGKIRTEGKSGGRLVMLGSSRRQWRDGVEDTTRDWGLPSNVQLAWQPTQTQTVLGNRFHLYVI